MSPYFWSVAGVMALSVACTNPPPQGGVDKGHDSGAPSDDGGGTGDGSDGGGTGEGGGTGGGGEGLMSLADATLIFDGAHPGDRAGRHVTGAGDLDGDGRADLYIGSDRGGPLGTQTEDSWDGRAYLLRASDLPASGNVELETAWSTYGGEGEGHLAGHSGGAAGDVDGDGLPDVVFSSYHADHNGHEQGRVYVVFGSTLAAGDQSLATADWIFGGTRNHDTLGHGLAAVGDVDGDELDDILMGACCGEPAGNGAVWIILGGEMDGPGIVDLSTTTPRWDGEEVGDAAGFKAGALGDYDGDGLADSVVSARMSSEGNFGGGKVYVISGGSVTPTTHGSLADADAHFIGTAPDGQLGYSMGPAGDIDGDGLDDLIVGAYQVGRTATFAGEAYVVTGATLMTGTIDDTDADLTITSDEEMHLLGVGVAGDMDLDGDGLPELVIGASGLAPPTLDHGGGEGETAEGMDSPGDAYLFWGDTLELGHLEVSAAGLHFEGEELEDHAGISVSSPGDVDGDGADDLLIGTERGQDGVGRAYLLTGLSPH